MKAVILAAGRGTRLGSLTQDIPKPMIQIAGAPALEHIIKMIKSAGVMEFVLVVRYRAEKILEHFGDGSAFGVHIDYVQQPDTYGTGAALLAAAGCVGNSPVLMTYGDVLTATANYAEAIRIFDGGGCSGVATLNQVPDGYEGSSVLVGEDRRIWRVVEKPPVGQREFHWNCTGVFVLGAAIFGYLDRLAPSARGEYELSDAMNAMIADGHVLYASQHQGFWRDIGTLEGIADAQQMLTNEAD